MSAITNFGELYAGKAVAITGASGYVAGAILAELGSHPRKILRASRKPLPPMDGTEVLHADIREAGSWDGLVSRADVIFHLASNTSIYAAAEDPAGSLLSTVLPLAHLVQAARRCGRQPVVVLAGTATQYGLVATWPVSEDTTMNPVTIYDLHKCQAEAQLLLGTGQGVVRGVALRLANVYGPSAGACSASERGVINKVAHLALQGKPLSVYGGGEYVRDYVHVQDVARAFLAAGSAPTAIGRAFNVASGAGIQVRDAFHCVAEAATRLTGRRVAVQDVPWPAGMDAIERRNFVGSITALREATGWRPDRTLTEGIEQMLAHFQRTTFTIAPPA